MKEVSVQELQLNPMTLIAKEWMLVTAGTKEHEQFLRDAAEEMRARKIMLVVSSVIIGLLAAVVIGFTVLLYMAVAFM